jgi:hypothetical protein
MIPNVHELQRVAFAGVGLNRNALIQVFFIFILLTVFLAGVGILVD